MCHFIFTQGKLIFIFTNVLTKITFMKKSIQLVNIRLMKTFTGTHICKLWSTCRRMFMAMCLFCINYTQPVKAGILGTKTNWTW